MSSRIFLVAAESSGDALGADLARALRADDPDVELAGVGGPLMAEAGIESQAEIKGLAVLGFVDGLLAYGRVKAAVAATVAAIVKAKPDAVVLIDSWGFTLRVALGVRAAAPEIRLVKYIGPQVWATRPGRAKTLAAAVDHLICIHDFEPPFYAPYGLPCTVCGHPALGRYKPGDGAAFRARQGFKPNDRVILVLPGSRPSEIRRIGPTLWRAAEMLDRDRPDVRLVVVAANAVRGAVLDQTPPVARIVDEREKEDAFAGATVALAASGTVTTEVALQGAPLVIGYKLGWITWAIARAFLFKSKFATLMNVAADAEVAPEFIQTRFTAENIAAAAARLLDDEDAREDQVRRQDEALAKMGRGGRPAAEIAAEAVFAVLAQPRLSRAT
ncbi:MAG: lipid-A-disaccharide synthase [Hyphomonadaceae bacterium]